MSWHQWGEAASIVWIDCGHKVNWSSRVEFGRDGNGYKKFAKILEKFSIHSCGEFDDASNEAWRTVQLRPEHYPSDVYTLTQIDAEMKKRFSK
jgi:hypothetical protein